MMESFVDGLIVSVSSETKSFSHFQKLQERGIPLVFFDRDITGLEAPMVVLDNYRGGFLATEHLIHQGCKRIAFLGGPENLSISNKRKEGYLAALKEYNMKRDNSLIIHCEFNQVYAQVATEELLHQKKKPDGIFAISDRIALGASLAIKEKGLRMPDDICLIGFNNEPITKLLSPTISSVDQPAFEMGKAAAKIFVELMNAHEKTNNTIINLKPTLVIRQSSQKIIGAGKR